MYEVLGAIGEEVKNEGVINAQLIVKVVQTANILHTFL